MCLQRVMKVLNEEAQSEKIFGNVVLRYLQHNITEKQNILWKPVNYIIVQNYTMNIEYKQNGNSGFARKPQH